MSFGFDLVATDGRARSGRLTTSHGVIETPVFMPVGTQGAVKALTQEHLADAGARIILGNTYHLHLRPGEDLIARKGGLHRFIGWDGALLTDSGGYQVFSLEGRRRITDAGVHFQSHLDGSARFLSPESAVDIQAALGSDIAMVFDECLAYPAEPPAVAASVDLTLRNGPGVGAPACWPSALASPRLVLTDSLLPPSPLVTPAQAQFGIVQGGVVPELREVSAAGTVAVGFEAYAIGGLSVGEPIPLMYRHRRSDRWMAAGRSAALLDGRRHPG